MAFNLGDLSLPVVSRLTAEERDHGVAYVVSELVRSGTKLAFPSISIEVPWDAIVAFVDPEPLANWAHPARYLLVRPDSGEVRSMQARFPPFGADPTLQWVVAYQAPGVPDNALGVRKS
jgi:hypothetical protein